MPAPCVFCEIVERRAAASVVYEDDDHLAFLDVRPLFEGHTLLVPKPHVETLTDLTSERVGPFFLVAQRLARAIPAALGAKGTFVAANNVVSQSVPHLHCHVVPRTPRDGLRGFFWPRTRYASDGERNAVAAKIADVLAHTD